MCKWVKEVAPLKTIRCYTGFLYENIKDTQLINYIDVLIDGKYEESLNWGPGTIKWRGSENQRLIDVQKTKWTGMLTILKDEEW